MKYSNCIIASYAIFQMRLCFLIMNIISLNFLYFSNVTIPFCLAAAFDERLALICVFAIFVSLILFVLLYISSLLGIRFLKMRKVSVFVVSLLSLMDLVSSFFLSTPALKWGCVVVSLAIFLINFKAILDTRKLTK